MYQPQHFVDLHDNVGFGGDPKSWLSGEDSSPILRRSESSLSTASGATAAASNVDRVLFNDLVEMVPLVQSLIDRKAKSSFTRRGSMIYTKTPSRESLSKKTNEAKGRNVGQSITIKRRRDLGEKDPSKNTGNNQDASSDGFAMFSARGFPSEKDREELTGLKEQVEDLQKKIFEKDELLKTAEISKNQMTSVLARLDELKHQDAEKDLLLKSTQMQLSDAKIKLADKQAALEKLQWEAMTSNTKVEKLQEDLGTMRQEISSFMLLFEGLKKDETTIRAEDCDIAPYHSDYISDIDYLDDLEIQEMEEAREAYTAAVSAVKENQDEESVEAATRARLHLQSIVLRTNRMNAPIGSSYSAIPIGFGCKEFCDKAG